MLEPLLTSAEGRAATRMSVSALYRRLSANTFPIPMKLSGGQLRWKQSEIQEWIDAQQRAKYTPPPQASATGAQP